MTDPTVEPEASVDVTPSMNVAPGPNVVDLHVGAVIRARRKSIGVTQQALADELGLTFQQVQKYERGANRVSASKLYDIARALRMEITALFEGLAKPHESSSSASIQGEVSLRHEVPATPEELELTILLPRMDARRRRLLLNLARMLTNDGCSSRLNDPEGERN